MLKRSLAILLLAISGVALASCGNQPKTALRTEAARSSRSDSASPSPSASRPNCPAKPILPPGPQAGRDAVTAAKAVIPKVYSDIRTGGFRILQAAAATRSTALGSIPYGMCDTAVGARTWIVRILFPLEKPSADLSHGVLFMGRFSDGWQVWFRYQ
jgi:hypothetical protein